MGAIPWLVLQLILVGLLIAFPQLVTYFLEAPTEVDLDTIQIVLPPSGGDLTAPPTFSAPPPPSFGAPPAPVFEAPPPPAF